MITKPLFITAVFHLKLSASFDRGDKLDDHTFIANSPALLERLLTPHFIQQVGALEISALRSAGAFIYSTRPAAPDVDGHTHLMTQLGVVHGFLTATWFFEDNSANTELAFYRDVDGRTYSNLLATRYSNATGGFADITLSREDLRPIRKLFRTALSEFIAVTAGSSALVQGSTRFERAHYFLQMARSESDLGLKVSSYCCALEALLATSSAELTHQLAERIACLLGDVPTDRLALYQDAKRLYAIRSKVVHGDTLSARQLRSLVDSSRLADSLVRQCFQYVFGSPRMQAALRTTPEQYDRFMLGRLFGEPAEPDSAV